MSFTFDTFCQERASKQTIAVKEIEAIVAPSEPITSSVTNTQTAAQKELLDQLTARDAEARLPGKIGAVGMGVIKGFRRINEDRGPESLCFAYSNWKKRFNMQYQEEETFFNKNKKNKETGKIEPGMDIRSNRYFVSFNNGLDAAIYLSALQEGNRSFLETIQGKQPVKLHFDLDVDTYLESDFPGRRAEFESFTLTLLGAIWTSMTELGLTPDIPSMFRLYDSSGHSVKDGAQLLKLSRHIVVTGFQVANNKQAKGFYFRVYDKLPKITDPKSDKPDNILFKVDQAVYGSLQQFRVLGSAKSRSNRFKKLIPIPGYPYTPSAGTLLVPIPDNWPFETNPRDFLDSMIAPVGAVCYHLADLPILAQEADNRSKNPRQAGTCSIGGQVIRGSNGPKYGKPMANNLLTAEEAVAVYYAIPSLQGFIPNEFLDCGYLCLGIGGSSWECGQCNKEHSRQRARLVFFRDGSLGLNCYGSEGAYIPLTERWSPESLPAPIVPPPIEVTPTPIEVTPTPNASPAPTVPTIEPGFTSFAPQPDVVEEQHDMITAGCYAYEQHRTFSIHPAVTMAYQDRRYHHKGTFLNDVPLYAGTYEFPSGTDNKKNALLHFLNICDKVCEKLSTNFKVLEGGAVLMRYRNGNFIVAEKGNKLETNLQAKYNFISKDGKDSSFTFFSSPHNLLNGDYWMLLPDQKGVVLTPEELNYFSNRFYRYRSLAGRITKAPFFYGMPVPLVAYNDVNTFPGFETKRTKKILTELGWFNNQQQCFEKLRNDPRVKLYTDHCFFVFADGDIISFNEIMSVLASSVADPDGRVGKLLNIFGPYSCAKSLFFSIVMGLIFGEMLGEAKLAHFLKFNGNVSKKRIVVIDEPEGSASEHYTQKGNIVEALKKVVTDSNLSVELKCKDVFREKNDVNLIFLSNHPERASWKDPSDEEGKRDLSYMAVTIGYDTDLQMLVTIDGASTRNKRLTLEEEQTVTNIDKIMAEEFDPSTCGIRYKAGTKERVDSRQDVKTLRLNYYGDKGMAVYKRMKDMENVEYLAAYLYAYYHYPGSGYINLRDGYTQPRKAIHELIAKDGSSGAKEFLMEILSSNGYIWKTGNPVVHPGFIDNRPCLYSGHTLSTSDELYAEFVSWFSACNPGGRIPTKRQIMSEMDQYFNGVTTHLQLYASRKDPVTGKKVDTRIERVNYKTGKTEKGTYYTMKIHHLPRPVEPAKTTQPTAAAVDSSTGFTPDMSFARQVPMQSPHTAQFAPVAPQAPVAPVAPVAPQGGFSITHKTESTVTALPPSPTTQIAQMQTQNSQMMAQMQAQREQMQMLMEQNAKMMAFIQSQYKQ